MSNDRVLLADYQHKPGGSCMVTALSGLYRYNGINLSPEHVVGLGSGLHFAYGFDPVERNYRVEFLSSQLFYSLLCNTGTFSEEFELVDNVKALARIFELLDNGMPVPVMMNPLYCEGLMKRTPEQFTSYIPSHMVVVYGYDLNERKIFLYDSPQFDPVSMDIDRFVEGRCSGPTLPANKHYEFFFPSATYPYDISVKLAIGKVIQVNKYSEKHLAHKSGIQAINRFAGNVKSWRAIFSDEEIINNARLFLMGVTNGHATKGAFRTQYSVFLKEVSEKAVGGGYYESSEAYYQLGKLWIVFQKYLLKLINDPGSTEIWRENSDFFALLDEISEKEKNALVLLENNFLNN